jgi:hypothetical protein
LEAKRHPLVVSPQITTAAIAHEPPATQVDGTDLMDEPGQIMSEIVRATGILVAGGRTREPRLHGPWKGISGAGLTNCNGHRDGKCGVVEQLEGGVSFGAQPPSCLVDIPRLEREASRKPVSYSKDCVDGALGGNRREGKPRPIGELVRDQSPDYINRHLQLVLVHGQASNVRSGAHPMTRSFRQDVVWLEKSA